MTSTDPSAAIRTSKVRSICPATILLHGHCFNFKHDMHVDPSPDQLFQTVDRLFESLNAQQVPYLLVGGIAMLLYVEGRNTQDIVLIMRRSDVDEIAQLVIAQENRDFARADYQGLQVDLLLTQNSLFEQVRQEFATELPIQNHTVPCATPQGLAILKLYALPSLYRQGQFDRAALYETDLLQLALHQPIDFDEALQVVDPHLIPTDRTKLRSILQDVESRLQRTQNRGFER